MPDLQETDNTEIFLNDRELAMGCPISTLETLLMVWTDMNKKKNEPGLLVSHKELN